MRKTEVNRAGAPISEDTLDQLLRGSERPFPAPSDGLRRAVLDDFARATDAMPNTGPASSRWLSRLAEIFEVPPAGLAAASLLAAILGGVGAAVPLTRDGPPAAPEEELLILAEDFAWPGIGMEAGDES